MLRVLDLFSGIGGFSLGLERTGGFRTVAFCEIDPFCRRVLARHWPEVPCHDDVRTMPRVAADVVCAGFPCQDISVAGKGAGLSGSRSGLWREVVRAVRVVRPLYVVLENVAALLGRGMGRVLGDLAEIGYDAEWNCIPASAVGAPHRRDRVWIMAYAQRRKGVVGYDIDMQRRRSNETEQARVGCPEAMADAYCARLERWLRAELREWAGERPSGEGCSRRIGDYWITEPDVGRVAYGVPARVDRLHSLGNAVVPQIPELIGRAILEAEGA